ncbi:MAG: GNAT family N-acetyltransferase [bacterium]
MEIQVFQDRHWPDIVARDWRELQQESESATIFQTWEWTSTWWKHFGEGKYPYVICVRLGDELIGIGAFYETSGAWGALRFMGNGHADYHGLLARTGFEKEVARRVMCHLMRHPTAHLLDLHQVPDNSPLLGVALRMPGAWRKLQAVCSRLELPDTWADYLSYLGRNMRSSLKRYEQAATRDYDFSVSLADVNQVDKGLKSLFKLHQKRWQQRGQPGAMFIRSIQKFHREFSKLAAEQGWLRLHMLELDGHTQAALYAFRFGKGYYFYQSGFNPKFGKLSPGTLTLSHAVRTAIGERCEYFDFLRGQEGYKARWRPQSYIYNYRVLVPIRGLMGQAAFAWNRLGDKVEHAVRERLEGGLGDHEE